MRSRSGPPKSSYTGTPSALALMSHNASSMPAIALWETPPLFWRTRRSMSQYRRSTGRGSCPTRRSARSRTQPAIPCGLRLSLHSPQPTRPLSVSMRTNVHGRQPPSQWSASTRAILMVSGRREAERAAGLGGEALERRRVHLGAWSQDEPVDSGRRVGLAHRLVRDVVAGRRHADLEGAEVGRPRVPLAGVAQGRHELLRLVEIQPESVPAVALGHRAAEGRWRPSAHDN